MPLHPVADQLLVRLAAANQTRTAGFVLEAGPLAPDIFRRGTEVMFDPGRIVDSLDDTVLVRAADVLARRPRH
ncbi:MAG TPA: hypothetical protein VHA07_00240 [Devosia sp.]|nr:hypothetical protein [Devosia sp.]